MSFVIGCDIGTQSTKGVLVDEDGQIRATASAAHSIDFPTPGQAQQDPNEWIKAVGEVLSRLGRQTDDKITHIGIAAQLDGVVAVDSRGRLLHPALIWMDRRAAEQADLLKEKLGADRIFSITGLNCNASHTAPKMMWLRDEIGSQVARFMPVGSLINSWLTGVIAQDPANASSTMLYDVTERRWSDELLEVTGLDPGTLPEVMESTDVVGRIRSDRAAELGLNHDIDVITGTGDDHASAIGAGAVTSGIIADVTGTAEPIGTTSQQAIFDSGQLVETHAHAVPGKWFIENPGFVSGGSVRWIAELLGVDQGEVFRLAAEATPGAKGLNFIPALSGAMAPRWNDHMRGAFTGLSMDHGPAELCRAVVEGCTFALRDNTDRIQEMGLAAARIHVTGGGARSDLWLQMKSDVTGLPAYAVENEGAAMGAVCLAAVAAGWFPDVETASESLVDLRPEPNQPDSALTGVYGDAYRRYQEVFDALEPVYQP